MMMLPSISYKISLREVDFILNVQFQKLLTFADKNNKQTVDVDGDDDLCEHNFNEK